MPSTPFHILVIDRDCTQRTDVIALLRAFGFAAGGVAPGAAAQRLVGDGRVPDLIIIDLDQPMVSRTIMAAMHTVRRLAAVPILGLSTVARSPFLAAHRGLLHLGKPIVPEELEAMVHRARRTCARTQQLGPVDLAL